MVRLKGSYEISDFRDRVISIPYGAIKSRIFSQSIIIIIIISIPYGAIKSKIAELTPYNAIVISIPYGAIKRKDGSYAYCENWTFQFLMVRLKGR